MRIAGMAGNDEERRQIGACKSRLSSMVDKVISKHGAPITVAALGELTAERAYVVAGPDLAITLFLELAQQIAAFSDAQEPYPRC